MLNIITQAKDIRSEKSGKSLWMFRSNNNIYHIHESEYHDFNYADDSNDSNDCNIINIILRILIAMTILLILLYQPEIYGQ